LSVDPGTGYFYEAFVRHGTLAALIERCSDPDRTTRKFACFAIGNAGFHSDALYRPLRAAIPPLVALLADEEDKTRANAAAALGNLVGRCRLTLSTPRWRCLKLSA
jgi:fused-like protein